MTSTIGRFRHLALVTALLAGCSTLPTAPPGAPAAQHPGGCGPCCGKDPAAEASATQGVSPANLTNPYTGKDTYTNVIVDPGTVLYSLTPGAPPGFAVAGHTLREAGRSWQRYYALVQVTTDPGKDPAGAPRRLRDSVRSYRVVETLCAARGTALANPQFGSGGGTQYYVSPADVSKLSAGESTPIAKWRD